MAIGRYELLQPHTINNVQRLPGFEFYVDTQHGQALVERGTAKRLDDVVKVKAVPRVAAEPPPPAPTPVRKKCCGGWGRRT